MKMDFAHSHLMPSQTSHKIKAYQYWIILQGQGTLVLDKRNISFQPLDVLELPLNCQFKLQMEQPLDLGVIYISDFPLTNKRVKHYAADSTGLVRKCFDLAFDVLSENAVTREAVMDALTHLLFQTLVSLDTSTRSVPPVILHALDEIKNNFLSPQFDIGALIQNSGYSAAYFRRLFQEETGVSPLQYLIILRIEHAAKLMHRNPKLTVNQIASECGYEDVYYFSRQFKKAKGMSPSEYMASIKNE